MTDEVCVSAERVRHEGGVLGEVDALDRWVRRKARPLEDLELEPVCERALAAPGRPPAHDAAVDEDDARAGISHCTNVDVFGSTMGFQVLQAA